MLSTAISVLLSIESNLATIIYKVYHIVQLSILLSSLYLGYYSQSFVSLLHGPVQVCLALHGLFIIYHATYSSICQLHRYHNLYKYRIHG